tara:strand:+ start:228 stop:467 length:240 start_codon:yes stop_codon:yes gene_type:complete
MDKVQLQKAKDDVRLTQLEIDTRIIKADITTIKDNHLKHMADDIDSIENKMDKLDNRVWAILFAIVTLAATNVLATWFA